MNFLLFFCCLVVRLTQISAIQLKIMFQLSGKSNLQQTLITFSKNKLIINEPDVLLS